MSQAEPIIEVGVNAWCVAESQASGLLIDARSYYRAFFQAARHARRSILIAGWQFDSGVALVRGEDDPKDGTPVTLLAFLDWLCQRTPELRIYILAWDFSVVFAMEREWMQSVLFNTEAHPHVQFRFDAAIPSVGSHHQKLVVIDRQLTFVGGVDLCDARWDDRFHAAAHPYRINLSGDPYGPYHEIQSWHAGPIASKMEELFLDRWRVSQGHSLQLPEPAFELDFRPPSEFVFPTAAVAISRTVPQGSLDSPDGNVAHAGSHATLSIHEIGHLYERAIAHAKCVIYIETQYFTSRAVYRALIRRMLDTDAPRLCVVLMLPEKAESMKEEMALGLLQSRRLYALLRVAKAGGHALGVYYTVASGGGGPEKPTYIHSKIMIVDDTFFTVGSANLTNRSMGLDTELNVSYETASKSELAQTLTSLRANLLAEHAGLSAEEAGALFDTVDALVPRLDEMATRGSHRLRPHPIRSRLLDEDLVALLDAQNLSFDPEGPIFHEDVEESLSHGGPFSRGMSAIARLFNPPRDSVIDSAGSL